jgi:hypothetical protein
MKDAIGSSFHAVEKELVFDIDLTDYDDVRVCCQDKQICNKCWPLMSCAIRVLHEALQSKFTVCLCVGEAHHQHQRQHRTNCSGISGTKIQYHYLRHPKFLRAIGVWERPFCGAVVMIFFSFSWMSVWVRVWKTFVCFWAGVHLKLESNRLFEQHINIPMHQHTNTVIRNPIDRVDSAS